MERKTIEFDEVKALDGGGTLEGYAAVFGNVDGHGDVITKGAFRRTISERVSKGRVPLLLDHKNEVNSILGTVVSAVETSRGLKVKAKLADVPEADRLRTLMKSGHRLGMSIGYVPVPGGVSYKTVDGQQVRSLDEVKIFEASVVAVGANEEAEVASVKSLFAPVRDQLSDMSVEERKAAVAELDDLRAELDVAEDGDGGVPMPAAAVELQAKLLDEAAVLRRAVQRERELDELSDWVACEAGAALVAQKKRDADRKAFWRYIRTGHVE